MFGEVSFLPLLAFPFVKVFSADDLTATEAVMAVLLNWAGDWVETFPHPPLQVGSLLPFLVTSPDGGGTLCLSAYQALSRIRLLLHEVDPTLAKYFEQWVSNDFL